jgi:hypothetical protein
MNIANDVLDKQTESRIVSIPSSNLRQTSPERRGEAHPSPNPSRTAST